MARESIIKSISSDFEIFYTHKYKYIYTQYNTCIWPINFKTKTIKNQNTWGIYNYYIEFNIQKNKLRGETAISNIPNNIKSSKNIVEISKKQ